LCTWRGHDEHKTKTEYRIETLPSFSNIPAATVIIFSLNAPPLKGRLKGRVAAVRKLALTAGFFFGGNFCFPVSIAA
jgi:hypothetical protein